MLTNYLKVAIRQIFKNTTFSLINIAGLSLGVACCVLLALFIQDEFTYEKHFAGHERVYRIYTDFVREGKSDKFPRISPPIAAELPHLIPEIETSARLVNIPAVEQHLIQYKDKQFYEKTGVLVDSTFFDIFPYPFLEGNPETALDAPSTVVITEVLARKIFNDKSAIDELIVINSGQAVDTFRITGILKTISGKSHVDAAFYMTMNSNEWGKYVQSQTTWAWNNFVSGYVKLRPAVLPEAVNAKLPALLEERAGNDLKNAGLSKTLTLQSLDDIRLYSDFTDSFGDMGDGSITYIYILGSIGAFILLIACINFMNLTTAKASQRAGEVGIRKSMGANRSHLIRQFLGESFTIVAAALILSLVFVFLAIPMLNNLTNKNLVIDSSNVWLLAAALLLIGGITGLLAGSYPAFFLSSFEPARVLKSKNISGDGSSWLRRGLVVFQFVISITLIASILIIHQQISFIKDQPLGFDDEQVLLVPLRTKEAAKEFPNLRNKFMQIPGVTNVTAATSLPSTPLFRDFGVYKEGDSPDKAILHRNVEVDENYFDVLGIKMLAGRDLISPIDTFSWKVNTNKIIVNEESLKSFGIDLEDAVGSRLYSQYSGSDLRIHEIIGVVGDFHQLSLHEPIIPMIFFLPTSREEYIFLSASVEGQNFKAITSQMEEAWKTVVLNTPFESQTLKESVEKQYEAEDKITVMLTLSTFLAIFISCMGLYGLSIFVAERKMKEIGIRKVLGASVPGIVGMLSKDFIILVMVAFVIAAPIGYYMMTRWLESFAYKTEMGVFVFILAAVISFGIAWLTVGFESIRAALSNPVKALKNE